MTSSKTLDPFGPKNYAVLITWFGYTQKLDANVNSLVEVMCLIASVGGWLRETCEPGRDPKVTGSVQYRGSNLLFEFDFSTESELEVVINNIQYITNWESKHVG